MYALNPKSARDFIDDKSVTLPRFQRKQTWDQRKNFRLALSLFKGYPLGTIILHVLVEKDAHGRERTSKYLLDGRQRRNALGQIENPEELWRWAKKTLSVTGPDGGRSKRLNSKTTTEQLREAFWNEIDDYFGVEDWEKPEADDATLAPPENSGAGDNEDADDASDAESEPAIEQSGEEPLHTAHPYASPGLNDLLRLLELTHPVTPTSSGLRRAFDFAGHLAGLKYVRQDSSGKKSISADHLLNWLHTLPGDLAADGVPYPPTETEFADWLIQNHTVTSNEDRVRKSVKGNWERIRGFFDVMSSIDQRLRDTTIGYLEIDNVGANDEKKIFEIINTEGEKLTAVEILSAKPAWNRIVDPVHASIEEAKSNLYTAMGIAGIDNVVRWDVAATLMDRLDVPYIIERSSKFEHYLTTGFKLYSGFYTGGISKQELDGLGGRDDIDWGAVNLERRASEVADIVGKQGLIKFWKTWDVSLAGLASDAVAMNYLLVLLKDWERKGYPRSPGRKRDAFQKNITILFDRMVYEYVIGRWRGSSDSRVARNLKALDEGDPHAVFNPVPDEDWARLIKGVIDDGAIEGESYTAAKNAPATIKLLLYYYYCLAGIQGPDTEIDIDHIIPRRLFGSLAPAKSAELTPLVNNMGNLALLPKDDNVAKRDSTLCEIEASIADQGKRKWLISQIETYEGIREGDFPKYCRAEDVTALIEVRGRRFKEVFTSTRQGMIGLG
jgi:hypothetical protein